MQEQIEQTSYFEKIKADYGVALEILQELKEIKEQQLRGDENGRI